MLRHLIFLILAVVAAVVIYRLATHVPLNTTWHITVSRSVGALAMAAISCTALIQFGRPSQKDPQ